MTLHAAIDDTQQIMGKLGGRPGGFVMTNIAGDIYRYMIQWLPRRAHAQGLRRMTIHAIAVDYLIMIHRSVKGRPGRRARVVACATNIRGLCM